MPRMSTRGSLDPLPSYPNDHYTDIETLGRTKPRQKGAKDRGKQDSIWVALDTDKNQKKSSKSNTVLETTSKKPKPKKSFEELEVGRLSAQSFVNNPLLENELKNWTLPRAELWCRDPCCLYNQELWGQHQHSINEHNSYFSGASNQVQKYQTISANSVREVDPPHQSPMRESLASTRLSASAEVLASQAQVHTNPPGDQPIFNNQHSLSLYQINRSDSHQHQNPPHYHSISSTMGLNSNHSSNEGFRTPSAASSNPLCPNCSGVVPLNQLDSVTESGRPKGDPSFWSFNKFQHPLQRDHSFHSVGGFTLNGQYNTSVKKHTMLKFCSSHKISLVVSTFSLLVTIGLLITLFLMKERGMMNTMDTMKS